MRLSRFHTPPTAPGRPSNGFDVSQIRSGDRLAGRVIEVSASGRTLLQFVGFQALAARPFGGRMGDVLQFEVGPRVTPPGASTQTPEPSPTAARYSPEMPLQIEIRQNGRTVRINVFLTMGTRRTHSPEPPSPGSATLSQPAPPGMMSAVQTALPLPSMGLVAAWFSRLRKNLQHLKLLDIDRSTAGGRATSSTPGQAPHKLQDLLEIMQSKHAERPGDTVVDAYSCGFSLGNGFMRFRLGRNPSEAAKHGNSPVCEAAFVLFLDPAGPVHTEIRLAGETLSVTLSLEHGDCRQGFVEALPDLEAALSPLARHCYCRVEVSPGKIHAFLNEQGDFPENVPLDLRI